MKILKGRIKHLVSITEFSCGSGSAYGYGQNGYVPGYGIMILSGDGDGFGDGDAFGDYYGHSYGIYKLIGNELQTTDSLEIL